MSSNRVYRESAHNAISTASNSRPIIQRRNSADSSVTLVNSEASYDEFAAQFNFDEWDTELGPRLVRLDSHSSAETLIERAFEAPLETFAYKRTLQLASSLIHSGLLVFPSEGAFKSYKDSKGKSKKSGPLLHVNTKTKSSFRKNAPYMIISKFHGDEKVDFCKVYAENVRYHLTKYTLEFETHDPTGKKLQLFMVNITSRPFTDTYYKNTRIRFTSPLRPTYGNVSAKMEIVNNEDSSLLIDEFIPEISTRPGSTQRSSNLSSFASVNSPVSSTTLNPRKLSSNGTIQILERTNLSSGFDPDDPELVEEDTIIISCMLLVLREQEIRKNRGHPTSRVSNSTFVTLSMVSQNSQF